ncbi:PD-(D/E)XK nuclease family protein [Lysinibacillus fusiformis]|nr:PD-(D/E)XK nuclease family protein [Lysinibacillus fusiformis]MDN4968506.1 PD-(D/E)XK nuclease family protein [Lysinibacillus fusiformis]
MSRLNTMNTCNFEYYNTYIKKNRGISNCYGEVGSEMHDYIENVYRGNITDTSDFNQKLHNKLFELELMDLDFPSEVIKNSFVKDMDHFTKNFNKLDGEFTLEKMFVTNIKGKWLLGYIDAIQVDENDNRNIIDWKTSSKFTGSKLVDAGRQLIIYKLGLENTSGININEIKWCMLKYINVCWKLKNGNIKKKMVNRGKLIKEMKNTFEKEMLKSGMDEIEVGMILMLAESNNSFKDLPKIIADKYWLEDCFVEYEATEEVIKEVEDYIVNTIEEIENKDLHNESEWKPLDFDKEGTFYCNTLCSHRKTCPFIKEYNQKNPYKKSF